MPPKVSEPFNLMMPCKGREPRVVKKFFGHQAELFLSHPEECARERKSERDRMRVSKKDPKYAGACESACV